ncbi:MAG: acyl-CoA dehydrogenase family protein [Candidatus Nanopelagicales bacterium]|nr:acyl-CoA dehydrogenase family protein [Candidatus Nanopelagicales bacterium]
MSTHIVTNQPPELVHNAFLDDTALREAVSVFGGDPDDVGLVGLGELSGSAKARQWGRLANENPPVLRTHDRYGNRVDEVEFHPAWHELMTVAVEHGLHAAPWTADDKAAHVRRAAGFMIWSQAEAGHGCPISMTYASVPALRVDPLMAAQWVPGLSSRHYDFGLRSPGSKTGLIAGMAMTEKQGGSDVRTNSTVAVPDGDGYRLTGHKWFCSAPMSDVFLVLAQAPGGLTCFIVPRVEPDGSRNVFAIQRLKDKLGNRSNASSEIEFENTYAQRLGDEGRGVRTIVEMVSATRLDTVLGSTALMRKALAEAIWHAEHREAFGARLIDQPLMRNVLADLALEVEAATWLGLRLAHAVDASEAGSSEQAALRRIALPMSKYYVCKRAPSMTFEAMECLGGVGYVEETGMPRLYREAPVNSIWEGSGNVNALDLLRAIARNPESTDAYLQALAPAAGCDDTFDSSLADVLNALAQDPAQAPSRARWLAERMALLLQASILVQHAPSAVSEAFIAARLRQSAGTFGVVDLGAQDVEMLLERAAVGRS